MQIRLITIINRIKHTFNLGHLSLLKNLFRTILICLGVLPNDAI
jgi:hypothetical protein